MALKTIFLFILTIAAGLNSSTKGQQTMAKDRFQQAKEAVLGSEDLKGSSVSWCFRDIQTGEILDSWNERQNMIPASTAKLFTTAIGLELLENEFRYETKIFIKGEVKKGQLNGDLIIIGSGDPSLGSGIEGSLSAEGVLIKIHSTLNELGIKKINGKIIVDPHCFGYDQSAIPRDWVWEDMGNYYGAGAFGLNWRSNSFSLTFSPGKSTDDNAVMSKTIPVLYKTEIKNSIKVSKTESDEIYLYSSPLSRTIFTSGKLQINEGPQTEKGAIPDPPFQFGSELLSFLNGHKINVNGGVSVSVTKLNPGDKWIKACTMQSPTLIDLVKEINQNSNNLFAECLSKTLQDSFNVDLMELIDIEGSDRPYLTDGSGLSRTNLVTTSTHTEFLRQYNIIHNSEFKTTLPEAGVSGTMKNFPQIPGLYIKSGSVGKVRAYAGYMMDKNGRPISFSILFNNFLCSSTVPKTFAIELLSGASERVFADPVVFPEFINFNDTLLSVPSLKELIERKNGLGDSCKIMLTVISNPTSDVPYYQVRAGTPQYCSEPGEIHFRINVINRSIEEYDSVNRIYVGLRKEEKPKPEKAKRRQRRNG